MRYLTICLIIIFLISGSELALAKKSSKSKGWRGVPAKISPPGVRTFLFNPKAHMWGVYDSNGTLVATGTANGGGHYCHDIKRACHTPGGTYRIMSKGGSGCKSTRYPIKKSGARGGAPMPYCMFFTTNYSIHGYPHLVNANVSHGCIRIDTQSAFWMRNYLPLGAKVIILSY